MCRVTVTTWTGARVTGPCPPTQGLREGPPCLPQLLGTPDAPGLWRHRARSASVSVWSSACVCVCVCSPLTRTPVKGHGPNQKPRRKSPKTLRLISSSDTQATVRSTTGSTRILWGERSIFQFHKTHYPGNCKLPGAKISLYVCLLFWEPHHGLFISTVDHYK